MIERINELLRAKERLDKHDTEVNHMNGGGYAAWMVKALELLLLAEQERQYRGGTPR
jgi:hypothetical protein